jgi:hypothetical protein
MFVKTNFEDSKLYATIVKFVIREHIIESNKIMYIWCPILCRGLKNLFMHQNNNYVKYHAYMMFRNHRWLIMVDATKKGYLISDA